MADYLFKDHKPSAMECKARLRGLYRIIYSKTITSVAACGARVICETSLLCVERSTQGLRLGRRCDHACRAGEGSAFVTLPIRHTVNLGRVNAETSSVGTFHHRQGAYAPYICLRRKASCGLRTVAMSLNAISWRVNVSATSDEIPLSVTLHPSNLSA